jgi:hypothetical protein
MRLAYFSAVVVTFVVGAPVASFAQSTSRPDLNVFGRGMRDARQSVGVSGSLGGTVYDMLGNPVFDPDGNRVPTTGWGTFGSASIAYNLHLGHVTFDGSLGGVATYYPGQAKKFRAHGFPGAGAQAAWSFDLGRSKKTHVRFGSSLRLRQFAQEAILPGGLGAGGFNDTSSPFLPQEQAFVDGSYLSSVNTAGLTRDISRRVSLLVDYQFRRDIAFGAESTSNLSLSLWNQTAIAALQFAVTRNLHVRGGYRYDESWYQSGEPPARTNTADIGVDYGRGAVFQLTRRTRLSFDGGVGAYVDQTGNRHVRLNGQAALDHQIGRSWSSNVSYVRAIDTADLLFQEPFLTDTIQASLNGLLTRRLGFHASASAQQGAVGFGGIDNGTLRMFAGAGLQAALGRHLAFNVDYSCYRYEYDNQVTRPVGLPSSNASQGVYVYLSAWAPIFQQRGRPNASR